MSYWFTSREEFRYHLEVEGKVVHYTSSVVDAIYDVLSGGCHVHVNLDHFEARVELPSESRYTSGECMNALASVMLLRGFVIKHGAYFLKWYYGPFTDSHPWL